MVVSISECPTTRPCGSSNSDRSNISHGTGVQADDEVRGAQLVSGTIPCVTGLQVNEGGGQLGSFAPKDFEHKIETKNQVAKNGRKNVPYIGQWGKKM